MPPQQPPDVADRGAADPVLANTDGRRTVSAWPLGQGAAVLDALIGLRISNTSSHVRHRYS